MLHLAGRRCHRRQAGVHLIRRVSNCIASPGHRRSQLSAMPGCVLPPGRPAPAASPHRLPAAAPQRCACAKRMRQQPEHQQQSSGRRRRPPPPPAATAAAGGSSGAADPDVPASDSPPVEAAAAAQQQGKQRRRNSHHPALEAINDATKWAVSAAAFGTLLWRRDLLSAFCVLGSIVAAINCRVSGCVQEGGCHACTGLCTAAALVGEECSWLHTGIPRHLLGGGLAERQLLHSALWWL